MGGWWVARTLRIDYGGVVGSRALAEKVLFIGVA